MPIGGHCKAGDRRKMVSPLVEQSRRSTAVPLLGSRGEVRHLIRACFHEGRAGQSARNIITAGGIIRKPVETIDDAQHIRHENIGDGESTRQPFGISAS